MAQAQKQKPVQTERVRGPNLAVLVKKSNGVPFEKAFDEADKAKRVMASSKRMDKALQSNEWQQVREGLWCWTGTMTGHVEPDRTFQEASESTNSIKQGSRSIVYTDPNSGNRWIFPVPEEHLQVANGILVAEHPDYNLRTDGTDRIVEPQTVSLVQAFPTRDDWYLTDSTHGIPTTENGDQSSGERYLWRIDKRVGPVARVFDDIGYVRRRVVVLSYRPSYGCGVVVEAASGGAPVEVTSSSLKITEEGGKLIVEGTPENLAKAKRALASIQ